ncbi:hypothetical protein B0H10DRAFT_2191704 [Mycena sp. CBHHK59/15]|nr:hypothetical protein B0H10DRAFT_2191704 [Mycena sp. CBHHK59/15]
MTEPHEKRETSTSSSPAWDSRTKIQPTSSSAPKNTGGERWVSQPVSTASAVPEARKSRKRRLSETHYDQVFREHGIRGVLDSLQTDHGKEFTGAHKAFLAARKSFSEAQYEEVADFFNLQKNTAEDPFEGWADLDVPQVLLPTSVLDESHVSPGSASELQNEAATAAFLAGPLQTLVCLFGGILKDLPEQHIPGTLISSDGRIEGEIFCREKLLLFARELKFNIHTELLKALAQVLCELFAAWHLNLGLHKDVDDQTLIPVRGCLCDASKAYFIGYNGSVFSRYITTSLPKQASLGEHIDATIELANYTFGVLLAGYLNAIKLYGRRSVRRGKTVDVDPTRGSHRTMVAPQLPSISRPPAERLSTEGWKTAVELGLKSAILFRRAYKFRANATAEKALALLYQSLEAWPTAAAPKPLRLPPTLEQLRDERMDIYKQTLGVDPDPTCEPQVEDDVLSSDVPDFRQQAVQRFWELLDFPPDLCESLEAGMAPKIQGDLFNTLAYLAAHYGSEVVQEEAIRLLPTATLAIAFRWALQKSHDEGIWTPDP